MKPRAAAVPRKPAVSMALLMDYWVNYALGQ